MRTTRWNFLLCSALLLFVILACNFSASTANISSLKLGRDKNISQESSSFGPQDTIYAVATISNASENVKVKGRLSIEDVPGQQSGPVPGFEQTIDLPGSGTATFTLSPPSSGWPKGKYKVEVFMMNAQGEQKDEKSASFTIS